jgi:hypothetical protein
MLDLQHECSVNRILSGETFRRTLLVWNRRKKNSGERWRGLFREQKESGQSVAVFCRERGLREWQFYEWKKRLRPAEAGSFVAVEVVASEPLAMTEPFPSEPGAPLEVRLRGGRSLLVGPDFEARHLRRLLQVLEQEP